MENRLKSKLPKNSGKVKYRYSLDRTISGSGQVNLPTAGYDVKFGEASRLNAKDDSASLFQKDLPMIREYIEKRFSKEKAPKTIDVTRFDDGRLTILARD